MNCYRGVCMFAWGFVTVNHHPRCAISSLTNPSTTSQSRISTDTSSGERRRAQNRSWAGATSPSPQHRTDSLLPRRMSSMSNHPKRVPHPNPRDESPISLGNLTELIRDRLPRRHHAVDPSVASIAEADSSSVLTKGIFVDGGTSPTPLPSRGVAHRTANDQIKATPPCSIQAGGAVAPSSTQIVNEYIDLFCTLYDRVDEDLVSDEFRYWQRNHAWYEVRKTFQTGLEARRPVADLPDYRKDRVPPSVIMAALCGMDEGFRTITLDPKRPVPQGGALLPRLSQRRHPAGEICHKRDLFSHVLRVPPHSWDRCDLHTLAPPLSVTDVRVGFSVACVPVIADSNELDFTTTITPSGRLYRVRPRDLSATCKRISQIVAALDRTDAVIAVAPEVTLSPKLLRYWQKELRRRRNSALRWVLAGTGDMSPRSARPRNTGVVLDARNGEVLGLQHKLYPFNMSTDVLNRWNLESRLGEAAIAEDIAVHPRRLSIFEAGAVRFAILVCEDLGRLIDIGPVIRDVGVTHLFVPVLARPLKRHHWEQSAASVYARDTGATVVVSNSLAIGVLGESGASGTALMLAPDGSVAIDSSKDPTEPVLFHLGL